MAEVAVSAASLVCQSRQFFENALCHALGCGITAGFFREADKLAGPHPAQLLVFGGGDEDGHIAVMPPDSNRLALGAVEQGGKLLFGFRGGDSGHASSVGRK
jgi:hypothetical protein